ncbi:solute carrier family 22 member 18 isoform X1 [Pelobates cultripes]|uniref:Organic cation transporter-like protein 2 n=1 Tax=Pelobates cultripes TaxID=61616 RepID=A0AAD1TGJ8_PELCU|nr:solute carrier family 22 member 18 isoform X1 [Pelobates cultripes]
MTEMASVPGQPSSTRRIIRMTYLIATVDISCLFMQFAVTPQLTKRLGLDTVAFGYLQTFFGILQLLGGPVFGRFSDQYGPRAALALSFLSSSLFYLILAFSTSIPFLFLSRLPCFFMHGLPGAQMIITDLTTDRERADSLGVLGLCFGIGIIIGSSIGGFLATRYGLYTPSFFALAGSLLSFMMVMAFFPAQTKQKKQELTSEQKTSKSSSVFNFSELGRLMKFPGVTAIFTIKILSGFPIGLFMIMFPITSVDFFGLDTAGSGYLMSYFGILQLVIQGVLVSLLVRRFSEDALLSLTMVVSMAVGLAMMVMTNVFHFCIIAIPMIFVLCISGVITDSILTKSVPPSDTGAMLGICASIQPFTRTIGPTIGGYLYKHYGVPSFGFFNLIVSLLLLIYFFRVQDSRKKT